MIWPAARVIAALSLFTLPLPVLAAIAEDDPTIAETYRKLARDAVKAQLPSPEGVRISWSGGWAKGKYQPRGGSRIRAYISCGRVHVPGITPRDFLAAVDDGRVLAVEIATSPSDAVTTICTRAVAKGMFPPLPASIADDETAPVDAVLAIGVTIRPMPDGAYVSAVATASPAAAAGLQPGMVIERVNGIVLAGMGEAMGRMIDAAGASATLGIVGGTTLKLMPSK